MLMTCFSIPVHLYLPVVSLCLCLCLCLRLYRWFAKRIADAEAEGVRLAAELEHLKAEEAREILQIEVSTPTET